MCVILFLGIGRVIEMESRLGVIKDNGNRELCMSIYNFCGG